MKSKHHKKRKKSELYETEPPASASRSSRPVLGRASVEENERGLVVSYEDYGVDLFDGSDYEATYVIGQRGRDRLRAALEAEGYTGDLPKMIIARFGECLEKESFAAYCKKHDVFYKLDTWIS
ncbi:MAG: hypothetical protein K6G16_08655 [Lachnospiraceae bacterium]|nr:hypothetical protein [Lachnospiraceae bacterium]